jgi:hypothetical protein
MADEQSPTVEIAPTVVISNSDNESENDAGTHSGIVDEPGEVSSHITAEDEPSSETVVIAEIEAGRDVALAEIAASVERDRIELEGERVEAIAETNREYEECRSGNSGTTGAGGNAGEFIDPAAAVGSGNGDGGITDSAGTRFDATIHSSPDARNNDGTFRRKRGRKPGGGNNNNRTRAQVHSDIKETAQFLAQGLLLFHASMAAMTKTPELILDGEEAQGLAESGLTLAAMYDITPDPKLQAAIFLPVKLE